MPPCGPRTPRRGPPHRATAVDRLLLPTLLVALLAVAAAESSTAGVANGTIGFRSGSPGVINGLDSLTDGRSASRVRGGSERGRRLQAELVCPLGSTYSTVAAKCLVQCRGGHYRGALNVTRLAGSTNVSTGIAVTGQCFACPPGEFREVDDTAAETCQACKPGTSNSRAGQMACVPCAVQGYSSYQDQSRALSCKVCPANTLRGTTKSLTLETYDSIARSVSECTCEKGFYQPLVNITGEACEECPKGASCQGGTYAPMSRPLYFGLPAPDQHYFLRCHRMINNESPCLGASQCLPGYEGMSCSRCKRGYYRFQRMCQKCEDETTEQSLVWAYFFLLVAFYLVKKLSTIILPSMYIVLTYIQCLSIVGNRQGWGTKRTKGLLKSMEIVNFPIDLFIPSCGEEMAFVVKAVFFTLTPVFYVLVDSLIVDPFFMYVFPSVCTSCARVLLWLIRLKYRIRNKKTSSTSDVSLVTGAVLPAANGWGTAESSPRGSVPMENASLESGLRYELGNGIMDVLSLQNPMEADGETRKSDQLNSDLERMPIGVIRSAAHWARNHVKQHKLVAKLSSRSFGVAEGSVVDPPLSFGKKMKKHFFEDMRLMYVSTTGALLKALRCTPVGDRNLRNFWLSDAWFGRSVLSSDPEQVCWQGLHAQLAPYFLIMLVLYAIGYPIAVFVVLRRAANPNVREGWHPKVYGRLYRRFEPKYYWWEMMYLARRICLTSFRVLMNDRRADVYVARTMQGWQGLCFLVTLIGALLAQFYAHPFKLEHMDLLDAVLLCCLFCIVWISMAFEIALKGTTEVDVLEGCVFLVVAVSFAISLFALLLDMYHSYIKSKKEPPRWIVFMVFTLTPASMMSHLGLSVKAHEKQVENIKKEIEMARNKSTKVDTSANDLDVEGRNAAPPKVIFGQRTRKQIAELERKLEQAITSQRIVRTDSDAGDYGGGDALDAEADDYDCDAGDRADDLMNDQKDAAAAPPSSRKIPPDGAGAQFTLAPIEAV